MKRQLFRCYSPSPLWKRGAREDFEPALKRIPLIPPFAKGDVTLTNFFAVGVLVVALLFVTPLHAHDQRAAPIPSDRQPELLRTVQLLPRLGARWPSDVVLRDEAGAAASLGHFISGKPAIVLLSYFNCSMLCPVLLEGVARSLKAVSLNVGRDFAVVVISIDPRDGPAEARQKKQELVKRYPGSGAISGWHLLTGDKTTIERITEAAGFGYSYDAATQQYAHPAALFVLNAETKLARVLYGVEPAPRDLRLALVEASSGRIGTAADQLLLYCYHYDPLTGKYGSIIMGVMRLSGLATLLALAGWISFMLLSDRSAAQEKPANAEP